MPEFSAPMPRYSLWQSLSAALSLSMRALEEVRALAARPPVKGPAGKDGFSADDLTVEHDGDRGIVFSFVRGADTKRFSISFPVILDRGVWREGQYEKGDAVSFGGSLFIAQEDTAEKPEAGKAWRLAVKRGRDGKDGVVRQAGPPPPVKLGA